MYTYLRQNVTWIESFFFWLFNFTFLLTSVFASMTLLFLVLFEYNFQFKMVYNCRLCSRVPSYVLPSISWTDHDIEPPQKVIPLTPVVSKAINFCFVIQFPIIPVIIYAFVSKCNAQFPKSPTCSSFCYSISCYFWNIVYFVCPKEMVLLN